MVLPFLLFCSCAERQRPEAANGIEKDLDLDSPAIVKTISPAGHSTWDILDNPKKDGWDSEVIAGKLGSRLEDLSSAITRKDGGSFDLSQWVVSSVETTALIPDSFLRTEVGKFGIERGVGTSDSPIYSGVSEVSSRWFKDFNELKSSDANLSFKVVGVTRLSHSVWETQVYITSRNPSERGSIFQQGEWGIRWQALSGQEPKIETLKVYWFERSAPLNDEGMFFSDCTVSLLEATECFSSQILQGVGSHARSMPLLNLGLGMASLRGFGLGDVNGDGLDDLYVCEDPGLPNRLYLQQPDGTMKEVSETWGCDWLEDSRSALLVDLDNDGDQDLVIGLYRGVAFFSNENEQRFQLRLVLPTHESVMHLCAVDYDMDGRLDLFSCSYNPDELFRDRIGQMVVGAGINHTLYDSNTGGANHLFQNQTTNTEWEYVDVTTAAGLEENNRRFSFAASWEDWDNDGDPDLYVANDFGRNCLYRNDVDSQGNHQFTDIAAVTKSEDQAPSMSVSWGDYNRDGLMDLFVGNMWSAAGQRITTQAGFNPNAEADINAFYQRFTTGSTLLKNQKSAVFEDVSDVSGVKLGRWAWASPFVDINNDGWEDLYVANGYISGQSNSGDL